jgi:hypothetical protein
MSKAWDIVAYTYKAEILCPDCTWDTLHGFKYDGLYAVKVEDGLTAIARSRGIDRMDESSFDSDDFPKVIFESDLDVDESCDSCGVRL